MKTTTTLAFGLALAAVLPGSLSAQTPALQEGYLELNVERLVERPLVRVLLDEDGRVLIPIADVLDHVSILTRGDGDATVLEWPPEIWNTRIVPSTRTVERSDEEAVFTAPEWRVDGGLGHATSEVLAYILGADVRVDFSTLTVVVSGRTDFPAIVRLNNFSRRQARRSPGPWRDEPDFAAVPLGDQSGGLAGNWGLSVSRSEGFERAAGRLQVGTSLFGGSAIGGMTGSAAEGADPSVTDAYLRYERVFDSPLVRRIEVGSVLGSGPLARRVVGAVLTNQPLRTPRSFGETLIAPAVPDGWEYEVYQGDYLVGVSSPGERKQVSAELDYGSTPVRVRMIGPSGQEVVEDVLFVVPASRVPSGEWRYSLGGGRCHDAGCTSYFFGEVIRGVGSRLTLATGVERLADGASATNPFVRAVFSPAPGTNVEVQAERGALFRASFSHSGARSGSLSASYVWNPARTSLQALPGWAAQVAVSRPVGFLGGQWVSGRLQLRGQERGSVDAWQSTMTTVLRRTLLSLVLESGLQERAMASVGVHHTPAPLGRPVLQDLAFSPRASVSTRGLEATEMGVSARPFGRALITTSLRFRREADPTFSIGVSLRTGGGHVNARTSVGRSSGTFVSADGGFAYSPSAGLLPLPTQSVGRSGVAGVVFYDTDGDGVMGADERAADGATIVVNGRRVEADEQGRFRSWESLPYEGVSVELDPLSVDADWYARSPLLIRPVPNRFSQLLIPVNRTREVEGRVVSGDGSRPLAGVGVEIVDESGVVVASERTYSDGVFYVQRVRPGRYTLRIAATSARALGLGEERAGIAFTVSANGNAPIVLDAIRLGGGR